MLLGHQGLKWVPLGPMRSAVSPPLSLSTGTGRFPRCLSPPLGAPVRCFPHFIYTTYSTNMMAYSRWAHWWLRVRGLVSPHLFLTCSGGGGGAGRSLSPNFLFSNLCLFICITRVPALKLSLGVYAFGTHDVTSDLVPLGFPSSHFQDSLMPDL